MRNLNQLVFDKNQSTLFCIIIIINFLESEHEGDLVHEKT